MTSERPPLVLLHGVLMTGDSWQNVVPLLSGHHEVHAFTTAGHVGGSPAPPRPATISALVDDAERYLDERGLDRPHLAGLSLGGWMALELARRGRATTVCALAPGGFWSPGDRSQAQVRNQVRKFVAIGRVARPLRPVLAGTMKSAAVRRIAWREAACHGDRITAAQSMALLDGVSGCSLHTDDLFDSREQMPALDPLPCPVTIAWSGNDRLVPVAGCDPIARERVPQASFTILPGVGHVPMIDDPALVARTILASTGAG